ncbi:MAG: methionyl-tRNA formyltransferase [Desulfobacteraceae bacterium]|mgnify:FL=1|nr:MAG: methionyl-tRNA formyltransferase [Desulfobacteraceae bacterium]
MGTPDFAVPSLERIAAHEAFEVPLVITQPDRPKGRGKKLAPPPVKQAAEKLGIEVVQPSDINAWDMEENLNSLEPDFFVVAAFGQILSEAILSIPKIFPINIHASLLPKYRGASPIQASILNMDRETGITTMVMEKGLDSGGMLMQDSIPISNEDTAQTMHDRLALLGADLIVDTLLRTAEGEMHPVPQDHTQATFARLLTKEDGRINWEKPSRQIKAHINAMTPWPGAFSFLNGQRMKIFKIHVTDQKSVHAPGTVFLCDEQGIHVSTTDNTILILELMGASGKRLTADAYLKGNKIEKECMFYLIDE